MILHPSHGSGLLIFFLKSQFFVPYCKVHTYGILFTIYGTAHYGRNIMDSTWTTIANDARALSRVGSAVQVPVLLRHYVLLMYSVQRPYLNYYHHWCRSTEQSWFCCTGPSTAPILCRLKYINITWTDVTTDARALSRVGSAVQVPVLLRYYVGWST